MIIKKLSKNKNFDVIKKYDRDKNLPYVSIVMAVFNEEKIIEQKIESVFATNYPIEKIEFLIGSDNSTDKTNELIEKLSKKYEQIKFFNFSKRTGKVLIINDLVDKSTNKLIISTDAKAIFAKDTIFELVKYFKDSRIKAVGGVLITPETDKSGISEQENVFMNREMQIKYHESLLWQRPIGFYGALYAIRKECFTPVPQNFLVDDFYINFKIYEKKGDVLINPQAKAFENLPAELHEEFRRKARIGAGNYQNLKEFFHFAVNPFTSTGFAFISHKVIRWTAPLIFLLSVICLIFLTDILFYKIILFAEIIFFILPLLDFLLNKINIHISVLRLVTHFIAMNLALVKGFFKFVKGIDKSVWTPSKRHK